MKDNFSDRADNYAKYRPTYPDALFDYLKTIGTGNERAWDCGTGNGQMALKLAGQFEKVFATDISQQQLDHAAKCPSVFYSLQPAEKTDFPDHYFDLILVAQAVHWFDFDKFYAEVRRTAKRDALLVILGYGRFLIDDQPDPAAEHFYTDILGSYWDPERAYIDEHYKTIPFPFRELTTPEFSNSFHWTFEQLVGYLRTWSAVKHYTRATNSDPLELILPDLQQSWGTAVTRKVTFPLLLRIGII